MLRSLKFTALTLGLMGATGAMAAGPDLTVVSFGGANKAAQVKAFYAPWEAAGNGKIVAGEYNGEMAKVKAMVDTLLVSTMVLTLAISPLYSPAMILPLPAFSHGA